MSAGNDGDFLVLDASTDFDHTRTCRGRNPDILRGLSFSSEYEAAQQHPGSILPNFADLSYAHNSSAYVATILPGPDSDHVHAARYCDDMTPSVCDTTPCYEPCHYTSSPPRATPMLQHDLPQQYGPWAYSFAQPAISSRQLEYDPFEGQRRPDQRDHWNRAPQYYQPAADYIAVLPFPLPEPIRPVPQSNFADQHVSFTAASGPRETFAILPQKLYQTGIPTTNSHPPIQFHGFSLLKAYNRETQDLEDSKEPALGRDFELAQKMAIVFLFPGCPSYSRQVHVFRSGTHPGPRTRAQLATVIAKEMYRFMNIALKAGRPLQSQEGEMLALGDLVLVDVRHVSQGSLQPTIGLIQRPAKSAPE